MNGTTTALRLDGAHDLHAIADGHVSAPFECPSKRKDKPKFAHSRI